MSEGKTMSKKQQAQARARRADILTAYQKKSHTGGFSDIGYITTGPDAEHTDTYIKIEPTPSRYLGKNMSVRAPKKGNLPEVYFDKMYSTLASSTQNKNISDTYAPPRNMFREDPKAKKELVEFINKTHKGKDFKMANYPAPSLGSGSYGGTFSTPLEHMPENKNVVKRGEPAKKFESFAAPNFKTKPAPKGSYGVPNTTFGKFVSLYVSTPEMIAQREKDMAKWEKKKAAFQKEKQELLNRPVFKGMSTFKDTFDAKKGSGITSIYDEYVPDEETVRKEEKARKKREKALKRKQKAELKKHKPLELPTFRYSSYQKSGEAGFFNKFPDTKIEVDEAEEAKKAKKRAKKEKAEAKARKKKGIKDLDLPIWKPVSGPKSSVIVSLLPRYY